MMSWPTAEAAAEDAEVVEQAAELLVREGMLPAGDPIRILDIQMPSDYDRYQCFSTSHVTIDRVCFEHDLMPIRRCREVLAPAADGLDPKSPSVLQAPTVHVPHYEAEFIKPVAYRAQTAEEVGRLQWELYEHLKKETSLAHATERCAQFRVQGAAPSRACFRRLVELAQQDSSPADAVLDVLSAMLVDGQSPRLTTFVDILALLCRHGSIERAVAAARDAGALHGLRLPAAAWRRLLDEAVHGYRVQVDRRVEPSTSTGSSAEPSATLSPVALDALCASLVAANGTIPHEARVMQVQCLLDSATAPRDVLSAAELYFLYVHGTSTSDSGAMAAKTGTGKCGGAGSATGDQPAGKRVRSESDEDADAEADAASIHLSRTAPTSPVLLRRFEDRLILSLIDAIVTALKTVVSAETAPADDGSGDAAASAGAGADIVDQLYDWEVLRRTQKAAREAADGFTPVDLSTPATVDVCSPVAAGAPGEIAARSKIASDAEVTRSLIEALSTIVLTAKERNQRIPLERFKGLFDRIAATMQTARLSLPEETTLMCVVGTLCSAFTAAAASKKRRPVSGADAATLIAVCATVLSAADAMLDPSAVTTLLAKTPTAESNSATVSPFLVAVAVVEEVSAFCVGHGAVAGLWDNAAHGDLFPRLTFAVVAAAARVGHLPAAIAATAAATATNGTVADSRPHGRQVLAAVADATRTWACLGAVTAPTSSTSDFTSSLLCHRTLSTASTSFRATIGAAAPSPAAAEALQAALISARELSPALLRSAVHHCIDAATAGDVFAAHAATCAAIADPSVEALLNKVKTDNGAAREALTAAFVESLCTPSPAVCSVFVLDAVALALLGRDDAGAGAFARQMQTYCRGAPKSGAAVVTTLDAVLSARKTTVARVLARAAAKAAAAANNNNEAAQKAKESVNDGDEHVRLVSTWLVRQPWLTVLPLDVTIATAVMTHHGGPAPLSFLGAATPRPPSPPVVGRVPLPSPTEAAVAVALALKANGAARTVLVTQGEREVAYGKDARQVKPVMQASDLVKRLLAAAS